jgi:ribosome-associated toxin RatA of RatAB toxin-antitoxin module
MPKASVTEIIPATANEVFDLIHDYKRRLEWDTMLQKAYLEPEFDEAKIGAISVCQGRPILGGFALRTEYVTFQRGKVAAVKLLNQPPFFETFAASIRHFDLSENQSKIVYEFNFTAKPKWLQFVLHPIMSRVFNWETGKRLQALKRFFEKS